jgi:hypothetical protein
MRLDTNDGKGQQFLEPQEKQQVLDLISLDTTPIQVKRLLTYALSIDNIGPTISRTAYICKVVRNILVMSSDIQELEGTPTPIVPYYVDVDSDSTLIPENILEECLTLSIEMGFNMLTPQEAGCLLYGIKLGALHADKKLELTGLIFAVKAGQMAQQGIN